MPFLAVAITCLYCHVFSDVVVVVFFILIFILNKEEKVFSCECHCTVMGYIF